MGDAHITGSLNLRPCFLPLPSHMGNSVVNDNGIVDREESNIVSSPCNKVSRSIVWTCVHNNLLTILVSIFLK